MKKILVLFCIIFYFLSAMAQTDKGAWPKAFGYTSTKTGEAAKGAVVSAHPLASQAGLYILQQGGNAFDAAITTQLALAVVFPSAGNLGGGGFLVAVQPNGNRIAIDYREMAPSAASRDMYLNEKGEADMNKSQDGHLSSGVPGTVAGIFESLKYARLPFAELIEPAIRLAEYGFVISASQAASFNALQADLKKNNTVLPVFYRGQPWKKGDTLIQKDLAATLKRIRDNGAAGFYEGETARLITEEMQRGHGIISLHDLITYKAKSRRAYQFSYHGHDVVTMPLPSSGGILIHQMLKMIEGRNISALGFHSAEAVQLMAEVEKRSFADRGEYLGDADQYRVPVLMITNDIYLQEKMKSYKPGYATPSSEIKPGVLLRAESMETTHLSVVDQEGNAVAVTTTLNNSYGSRTVVGGAGFFLNDEMDDFSIKPGQPNMYGAIGGMANAIAPGKRMLSSMTPTIVLKEGKPFIITGTPGGTTIPTSVFQTLVNIIDFKLSPEQAINAPKFHHQWLPDELLIEKGFPQDVMKKLEAMGYTLKMVGGIGRTELIIRKQGGGYTLIADRRGEDDASGY